MFVGYLFLRFKDSHKIRQINPSQILMNLQYVKKCLTMQHVQLDFQNESLLVSGIR